jgi:pimeloyl-ACP methyl ester carboxylesterase
VGPDHAGRPSPVAAERSWRPPKGRVSTGRDGGATGRDGGATGRDGGATGRDGGATGRDGGARVALPGQADARTLRCVDSFERDGLRFDVRDGGPSDAEVVALLHGFPQDCTAWDDVTPVLHEAGLRTLAPDQRGYSPGARPSRRTAYSTGEGAGDLIALLDAAGAGRAHVVGHDWGGVVAWVAGCRYPERVASLVVLSAPHPAAMTRALTRSAQSLRSWYIVLFQLPVLPELLLRHALRRTLTSGGLPDDRARHYSSRMREPGALTGALNWYRGLPSSLLTPVRDCPVPTTYVWGREDFALGRVAAEATGRQVAAPYRFVELAAGHWLPETRPREVASVILDRVLGPGVR